MTSISAASASPGLAWFLRGQFLDRVVLILSWAAVVTEFFVLGLSGEPPLGYTGVIFVAAGLILSRVRRTPGLIVVVLGAVAAALLSTEFVAAWSVVVFALFSVTVRGSRAIFALLVAGVPVYLSLVVREHWDFQASVALVASACCAVGAAVGSAVRAQQGFLESMRQRALDAEAAADLAVERGIAEERVRIARDLHDVVGHEVAVIGMHLGVAEVSLPAGESPARTALESARAGVRRVLHETQLILAVLRRGGDDDSPDRPAPDMSQIPALVETFRAAGVAVDFVTDGDTGGLDPMVGLAAFRIVQEALTNAQRHGRGKVELAIRCADGQLSIVAENDCASKRKTSDESGGYGLVGMRERARSAGGRVTIDDDGRRFRLTSILKTDGGMIR
ncbi:sensor histidine kinase [Arthrobacter sp. KNU40]|uniref:sensor histidine kinase n=1 Tax=Arthrobacter sp. KNU40 TaxID=3447965 RepID=UPI003F602B3C